MLKKIDYQEFKTTVEEGHQTCAVFITRDNCSVCSKIQPKLENISEEYSEFPIYMLDIYDASVLLMDHHLKSVPQVFFYDEGEFHLNIPGDTTEDDLALKAEYLLYYK